MLLFHPYPYMTHFTQCPKFYDLFTFHLLFATSYVWFNFNALRDKRYQSEMLTKGWRGKAAGQAGVWLEGAEGCFKICIPEEAPALPREKHCQRLCKIL